MTLLVKPGKDYVRNVRERQDREAQTLANLTGWDITDIRTKLALYNPAVEVPTWWDRVFDRFR